MAGVVKWLRPRIVVPICVGSNPTTRPTKKEPKGSFFIVKILKVTVSLHIYTKTANVTICSFFVFLFILNYFCTNNTG